MHETATIQHLNTLTAVPSVLYTKMRPSREKSATAVPVVHFWYIIPGRGICIKESEHIINGDVMYPSYSVLLQPLRLDNLTIILTLCIEENHVESG